MDALAALLSWSPHEGSYALISHHNQALKVATLYVAGENGVPPSKVSFIKRLWAELQTCNSNLRYKPPIRSADRRMEEGIPQSAITFVRFIMGSQRDRFISTIRDHLPCFLRFRRYVTPENIEDPLFRGFLLQFIEMLEKTAKCVEHLEETGLYACVDALLKNEKWLMMWMLYSPNFQDRTGANWQLIDEIAQQNHITCEAEDEDEDEDEDMDYSEDEEQDVASRGQHFSHHFFNVIAPFRYAQILMEAVKSPAEGPFFKAILNIEEIDPKDIDGIPGNARTSCSFERLHQTEDSDTESDISTPAGPRLHPELQVAEAIQTLPSIPGMDSHISTSRPVCRACEALFRSGMFGDVNVRKGANFYNLITGS